MQKFDPGHCVEELTMWTAATILIRRSHDGRRRSHLRNASPPLSPRLARSPARCSISLQPRRETDSPADDGATRRRELKGRIYRDWKNPTDISKWSFLIMQRICREGQASRLATLSLTVKSDPQRPERARPATSRVARTESRSGRTSRKNEGGTREGPDNDCS